MESFEMPEACFQCECSLKHLCPEASKLLGVDAQCTRPGDLKQKPFGILPLKCTEGSLAGHWSSDCRLCTGRDDLMDTEAQGVWCTGEGTARRTLRLRLSCI